MKFIHFKSGKQNKFYELSCLADVLSEFGEGKVSALAEEYFHNSVFEPFHVFTYESVDSIKDFEPVENYEFLVDIDGHQDGPKRYLEP